MDDIDYPHLRIGTTLYFISWGMLTCNRPYVSAKSLVGWHPSCRPSSNPLRWPAHHMDLPRRQRAGLRVALAVEALFGRVYTSIAGSPSIIRVLQAGTIIHSPTGEFGQGDWGHSARAGPLASILHPRKSGERVQGQFSIHASRRVA
jgi:hypothetical protein